MKTLDSELIPILEEKYGPKWWPVQYPEEVAKDPFKNLILTVLSQNTSEVNCIRAYKGLSAKFEVKPEILAHAKEVEVREAIRSGGLYNVKAKRIKELSKAVLENFGGDLTLILSLPKEEARKKLMELPGIGPKTADVLLSSRHGYSQVFVVDTHMDRIAKRLGLVKPDAKYEEIQVALKNFIPWDKGEKVGGLFWLLTKYTCRAQNPQCYECPLIKICDYEQKTKSKKRGNCKFQNFIGNHIPFFLLAGELVDGFRAHLRLRKLRPPSRHRNTRNGVRREPWLQCRNGTSHLTHGP